MMYRNLIFTHRDTVPFSKHHLYMLIISILLTQRFENVPSATSFGAHKYTKRILISKKHLARKSCKPSYPTSIKRLLTSATSMNLRFLRMILQIVKTRMRLKRRIHLFIKRFVNMLKSQLNMTFKIINK